MEPAETGPVRAAAPTPQPSQRDNADRFLIGVLAINTYPLQARAKNTNAVKMAV